MGIRTSIVQNSVTIQGTTSNPTFGTPLTQQISYRLLGDKYRITYQFGWSAGGSAGSGDYLITLPSGLSFHTGGQYNQTYATVPFVLADCFSLAMIPAVGGIVQSANWSTSCFVVPYDSTRFRLVVPYSGSLTTWSNTSYGVTAGLFSVDFEIWQ
jgi:hypothetical protein